MNNKCAVILCGGKGSRLGLLGKKIPKTLVKVQGKEILWYIIKYLKFSGFSHIILPLGYKGNQIKEFLKKNKSFDIKIEAIQTGINSNIGSRISKIIDRINQKNFLLLNGDAIFDIDLISVYKKHNKKNYAATFLSGEVTYPYGSIGVLKNKVIDFRRNLVFDQLKVRNNSNYIGYNFTGICLIKTEILKKYNYKFKNSKNFEQTFYPKIIKKYLTNFIKIDGFWHSIDNIKDLAAVDLKEAKNYKYNTLKKIKKFLL
tara:strand:- start:14950 stop:15723 length:774 start_codon:yes stop_codon:yes gene_type:complete